MYIANVDQLARLYSPQVGRGADDKLVFYKSDYRRQRGHGLGSIFGAIARKLIPFAKNILWPAAKKHLLPHAISAATNLGEDILAGKNVLKSVKQRGSTALGEMGSSAIKGIRERYSGQSQAGSGRGRKKRKVSRKPKRAPAKKRKITKGRKPRRRKTVARQLATLF